MPPQLATLTFPAGTPIRDIGYWNLLYDQLGDEGFDYSADGTGYTSNVINWNSADQQRLQLHYQLQEDRRGLQPALHFHGGDHQADGGPD